jgi:pimeloyl-ACP methyl ester carboxylesterase
MKTQLADAVVSGFPGCGHALHIQDADRFNRLVIDFLNNRGM